MSTILLDCDGVLADFSGYLLRTVNSDRGAEAVCQWDIFSLLAEWHGPEVEKRAIQCCNNAGFWEAQPVVPYAQEAVAWLRSLRHRIVVVTAPWYGCRGWESVRREWLEKYFEVSKEEVIITANKELIRGDLLVDDRPKHLEDWHRANPDGRAVCFDASYNRPTSTPAFDWPWRIHTWRSNLSHARAFGEAC